MPKSNSAFNRDDHHNLELCCSPNPSNANPFLFQSFPWILIKTRVHMFLRFKQDGQEFKRELT
jgi:hypothetical protein